MRYCHLLAVAMTIACSSAVAQTPLSAYVDSNGFIDVQKLTCAQLAGTYQEDADALTSWYSGWYNGLAKKHMTWIAGKSLEHEVIQSTARQIPTRSSLKPSTWCSRSTGPRRVSKSKP